MRCKMTQSSVHVREHAALLCLAGPGRGRAVLWCHHWPPNTRLVSQSGVWSDDGTVRVGGGEGVVNELACYKPLSVSDSS